MPATERSSDVDAHWRAAARDRRGAAVALVCHVNPDGDALGSMLGAAPRAPRRGRRQRRVVPEPFVVAPHYRELPGPRPARRRPTSHRRARRAWSRSTAARSTGSATSSRREGARASSSSSTTTSRTTATARSTSSTPDAAASGVLVRRLIERARPPADPRRRGVPLRGARVRHRALPVRVHHARRCSSWRVSSSGSTCPSSGCRARCSRSTGSRTSSSSPTCSAGPSSCPSKRFVWTKVTQDDLERHGVTFEEVEGLIDLVRRTARGRGDAACSRRAADGTVARQPPLARRRRRLPIAEHEGGGGHRFAAGFTSRSIRPSRRRPHPERSL